MPRQQRSNPKTKHIPLVFILEENEGPRALEGVQFDAKDTSVTKPFDIEEIKRYVERVVPRNPRASGTVLWQSE